MNIIFVLPIQTVVIISLVSVQLIGSSTHLTRFEKFVGKKWNQSSVHPQIEKVRSFIKRHPYYSSMMVVSGLGCIGMAKKITDLQKELEVVRNFAWKNLQKSLPIQEANKELESKLVTVSAWNNRFAELLPILKEHILQRPSLPQAQIIVEQIDKEYNQFKSK